MDSGKILERSESRFQISNEGWTRMNAGRSAATLIREAISNTFDADGVTSVKVWIEPGSAVIEDDSPVGIGDFNLVTTVFLTDKADSPTKRGRKGRGLKELISAAETATVSTIGFDIIFGKGREVVVNDVTRGTKVAVVVPQWTTDDVMQARVYLERIIPPAGVRFEVNGIQVKPRMTRSIHSHNLKTQTVRDGVQVDTYNTANVHVVNLAKGETQGWLYEMGIPVQAIKTKFHVDVQQRIPLNDNRDTAEPGYLGALYGHLLEDLVDHLSMGALKQEWAQQGMHYVWNLDVKTKIVKKMYGDINTFVIKTQDKAANDLAKVHGYKLVDLAGLSGGMESLVNDVLKKADIVAKTITINKPDLPMEAALADPHGRLAAMVRFLGQRLLSAELSTHFFSREVDYTGVQKKAHFDKAQQSVGFNVQAGIPLHTPLDPKVFALIVHEFAHQKFSEHDDEFHREVEALSGKLAVLLLADHETLLRLVNQAPAPVDSGKVQIICIDCGAPRDIFPQDVHQVKRCAICTKKARRQRAKDRQAGKV